MYGDNRMENIVIRMRGGLGNQLFQLAYGIYLKKYIYKEARIVLDIREYDQYKIRDFELYNYAEGKELILYQKKSYVYDMSRKLWHLISYLYRKQNGIELEACSSYMQKMGFIYTTHLAYPLKEKSKRKNCYVYGYFQDVKMVDTVRREIERFIESYGNVSPTARCMIDGIKQNKHSIAISMRLGKDFIIAGQPISKDNFYFEAVKKIINPESILYVFSDSFEQAKKYDFGVKNKIVYVEQCNHYEQILIMKECKDFVISNSSFAWWGAYLSNNTKKMVIVPPIWMNGVRTIKDTRYYENMSILEY